MDLDPVKLQLGRRAFAAPLLQDLVEVERRVFARGSGAGRCAAQAGVRRGGLSKYVDLKLVDRLEFGSGAVAMKYEPRR